MDNEITEKHNLEEERCVMWSDVDSSSAVYHLLRTEWEDGERMNGWRDEGMVGSEFGRMSLS